MGDDVQIIIGFIGLHEGRNVLSEPFGGYASRLVFIPKGRSGGLHALEKVIVSLEAQHLRDNVSAPSERKVYSALIQQVLQDFRGIR